MYNQRAIISIDIGGSKIRASLIAPTQDLPIVPDIIIETDQLNGAGGVIHQVNTMIQAIIATSTDRNITGVSISVPGLVDPRKGIVRLALNLPQWNNIALVDLIRNVCNLPVILINDANAAVLGEWYYFYQKAFLDIVFITVSTGIGAGIFIKGMLLDGITGGAGEIGHMSVDYTGPKCHECGRSRGCLTTLASGTGIVLFARKELTKLPLPKHSVLLDLCKGNIDNITTQLIVKAACEGDVISLKALNRAGRALGQAVVNVVHILDPDKIILGGGVLEAGSLINIPMQKVVSARLLDPDRAFCVEKSHLGIMQGIAGATVNAIIQWGLA